MRRNCARSRRAPALEDDLSNGADAEPASEVLIECPDCGLLHCCAHPVLHAGRLFCRRCDGGLFRRPPIPLDVPLALATASLILLLTINTFPIFIVSLAGRQAQDILITGALRLTDYGAFFTGLGILVGLLSFAVPTIWFSLVVLVLAGLKWGSPDLRPRLALPWKFARLLQPWSMLDVYLLGTYVAFTRLADTVETTVGSGGYSLAALVLSQAVLMQTLGRGRVWNMIADPTAFAPPPGADWISCKSCRLVVAAPPKGQPARLCPRCGETLERRRPVRLQNSLALMIAAAILYIPANILPMLTVIRFGRTGTHTILSGVQELARLGMWPLALLVAFASIAVPLAKLLSLAWFHYAVHRRSAHLLRTRTSIYRLIDFIGRWSNIDVFMASILIALLQYGPLMTVDPEPGLLSFATVVVLTMLATSSFDPRFMWDAAAEAAAVPTGASGGEAEDALVEVPGGAPVAENS